jgi:hypothetical protein
MKASTRAQCRPLFRSGFQKTFKNWVKQTSLGVYNFGAAAFFVPFPRILSPDPFKR